MAVDVPVGRDGSWEKVTLFHVEVAERVPVTETVMEMVVVVLTEREIDAFNVGEMETLGEPDDANVGEAVMEAIEILGLDLSVDVCDTEAFGD